MRRATISITPDTLVEMCKPSSSWHRTAKGLPVDARLVGVGRSNFAYDAETHSIIVVVESEEFEEVKEGSLLPAILITFETWDGISSRD